MTKPLNPIAETLDHLVEQLPGTTLTAPEVVRMASTWWDKVGRKIINKHFNLRDESTFRGGGGGPAIVVRKTETEIPSRIMAGKPWAELDKREQVSVAKAWLSQYRQIYSPKRDSKVEIHRRLPS